MFHRPRRISIRRTIKAVLSRMDNTAAAKNDSRTAPILAEVCKLVGNSVVANGYYPVYIDNPRGDAGYCAWHSAGTCNGNTIN